MSFLARSSCCWKRRLDRFSLTANTTLDEVAARPPVRTTIRWSCRISTGYSTSLLVRPFIRPKGTNSGGDDRFSQRHGLADCSGKAFAEGGMDQDVHQRQDLEGLPPPSQEDDMVHVFHVQLSILREQFRNNDLSAIPAQYVFRGC